MLLVRVSSGSLGDFILISNKRRAHGIGLRNSQNKGSSESNGPPLGESSHTLTHRSSRFLTKATGMLHLRTALDPPSHPESRPDETCNRATVLTHLGRPPSFPSRKLLVLSSASPCIVAKSCIYVGSFRMRFRPA